jgi:hypothetical protein
MKNPPLESSVDRRIKRGTPDWKFPSGAVWARRETADSEAEFGWVRGLAMETREDINSQRVFRIRIEKKEL